MKSAAVLLFCLVAEFNLQNVGAGKHVIDGTSENITAQLNVTTTVDSVSGTPALYSGETILLELGVEVLANVTGLAIQLNYPDRVFSSANQGVDFPREVSFSKEGFLNSFNINSVDVQATNLIKYNFGDALVGSGYGYFTLTWKFNMTAEFVDDLPLMEISAVVYDSLNQATPILNLTSIVAYLGADLKVNIRSSLSEVEAADQVDIVIEVAVGLDATDPAEDTQVQVMLGNSLTAGPIQYFVGTSLVDNSSSAVISREDLASTGLTGLTLNASHSLYIITQGVIKDTVELNHVIPINVHLAYFDGNRSAPEIKKTFDYFGLNTKSPVVTVNPPNLNPELPLGYPVTMEISIVMGKGKLTGLHVKMDGTTDTTAGLSLSVAPVSVDSPSGITVTDKPVDYSRRRRATTVSDTVLLGTFYNPSLNPVNTPITITISFRVSSSNPNPPANLPMSLLGQLQGQMFGTSTTFLSTSVTLIKSLTLSKSVQLIDGTSNPNKVLFEVVVEQPSSSSLSAYNLRLRDNSLPGMQASTVDNFFYNSGPAGSNLVVFNKNRNFLFTAPNLPSGENMTLRYSAVTDDEDEVNEDLKLVYYEASVTFYTYDSASYPPEAAIELKGYACILREFIVETSIFYQQGLAALTFFIALIVGALVVILIIFILIRVCKKNLTGSITPNSAVDDMVKDKGNRLLVDSSYMRKGGNTITDLSMVGVNDSIVSVLALKDKLQMYREIDNLDILSTITVDTEIEAERNKSMNDASVLLIRGLRVNNDITKDTEDKAVGMFQANERNLEKRLAEEYRLDSNIIFKDISIKNKNKLSELIKHQSEEKRRVVEETAAMEEKDRRELMDMMDQQHESEQNEVTYKLKLEQDELTEKLRKEYAVRKRMGLKELQQQLINETVSQGKLNEQQADWLIKEHQKVQAAIDKMYDDEISRQRMSLEEKLARRRALAHASDMQEDDESDILNTMAGHQLQTIKDIKKKRAMSAASAEQYIEKLKSDMLQLKNQMDRERTKQEQELHQRLSALKAKKLAELAKKQEEELNNFNKKNQEQQTDGPVDPLSYIGARQQKMSEIRSEKDEIESEMDMEHAAELQSLRKSLGQQTERQMQTMEDQTLEKLKAETDLTDDQVRKILKQHEQDTERMKNSQQAEREAQRQKLREKLIKNKQEASQRREEERLEQEQLREHETNVVQKLINNQLSMSEAERDKILKEHEKQMVQLENSLTLNKLRQKKNVGREIAEKRSQQMEKLQMKQNREYKKLRQTLENNGEESDEEGVKVQLAMMKRHTEQKLAVIQGQRMDIDTELEGIRIEMMKERAVALKEQEEQLGAMLATLQMEKARELAKIEQQQKAINNLKLNLMDDLTDRGVLSNPECQRVIDVHKQEQENLQKKLDSQRIKQEKVLRQRLQQRLQEREQLIGQLQEKEIESASRTLRNKTSIKVKKMLMMTKHMVASEKFRNQMERERDQTLESLRQQYEVMKMKAMQEQELKFISGLIRLGRFRKSELSNVVKLLFPGRSPDEANRLLQIMCEHADMEKTDLDKDDTSLLSDTATSRLEERIRVATLTSPMNSTMNSTSGSMYGDLRKGSMKSTGRKASRAKLRRPQLKDDNFDYDDDDTDDLNMSYKSLSRPEPLGQDHNEGYVEATLTYDDESFLNRRRLPVPPQGALEPIEVKPKRKKKKSTLKKLANRNAGFRGEDEAEYSV
ncbi:LOW QUALITY PROTEIN: uncharacterized protein LOC135467409 [Liolophura sinensis]|uniref:LOW QUALITY PROTEIN: uncharacterized protein LOC135467409 n=1 Tax=Liolophura sinensis TaxID=3198878 RepID=UPI00315947FF